MTTLPDPHSQLRPYAGSASPDGPAAFETTASAWNGRVTVRHIKGLRGQVARETPFMVTATWTGGQRMDGFAPGAPAGESSDMVMVPSLEIGREIAMRAADELSALRVPDLRALLRDVRNRAA